MTDNDIMDSPAGAAQGEATFSEKLNRARKIVQLLEQGDVDLETGAAMYKEACECLAFCREKLANVRNEIEELNGHIIRAEEFLGDE